MREHNYFKKTIDNTSVIDYTICVVRKDMM